MKKNRPRAEHLNDRTFEQTGPSVKSRHIMSG